MRLIFLQNPCETDSPKIFIDRPFPPDELWVNPEDKYNVDMEQGLNTGGIESLLLRTTTGDYLSARLYLGHIKDLSGKIIGKRGVIWDLTQDPL